MINLNTKKQVYLASRYPQTTINYLYDKICYRHKPTPFPRLVNCFITEACNFNCPMCHVKESRKENMSLLFFNDLKRVFIESAHFFPSFQLTGGEPLLHPELMEMIRFLQEKQMVKGIVTNGLILEEKAEELVNAGLDFLAISLDGPDEKTQYLRGYVKGSFAKIIKGVKKVIEARRNKTFPNIRLATVVSDNNLHNFEKVLEVAEELGVDQWSLSHFFYFPKEMKTMQETFAKKFKMGKDIWGEPLNKGDEFFNKKQREIIKDKYRKILEYQQSGRSKIRISFQPEVNIEKYYLGCFPSQKSICTSPYNQIFIRGNGNVEMCQGYILGNIKKDNIKNIWHNEKAKHFREVFTKVGVMPACFRCCALNIKFD